MFQDGDCGLNWKQYREYSKTYNEYCKKLNIGYNFNSDEVKEFLDLCELMMMVGSENTYHNSSNIKSLLKFIYKV